MKGKDKEKLFTTVIDRLMTAKNKPQGELRFSLRFFCQ